ncbi:type II toxin-antitoxin system HicA family toxin [Halomontanus rarus]|uniref:type II toxin-antitoxin system HicA family toxin n=1 Tax=Halomontanus rarus TaxID=3034020 RepID=UPI00293C020D|nr:type II toxin-antitoxin system HicA family toxin [Halovivax sp. KZCA124]
MAKRDFSGLDVVKALPKTRFRVVDREGSHVKSRYEHPSNTDDVRVVSVPTYDRIRTGTLRNIADQSGANDSTAGASRLIKTDD